MRMLFDAEGRITRAHERVPECPEVGAVTEFLGENISAVDFS